MYVNILNGEGVMDNYKKIIACLCFTFIISCSAQPEPAKKQVQPPKTDDAITMTVEVDNVKQFNEVTNLVKEYEKILITHHPSNLMIDSTKVAYLNLLRMRERIQATDDKSFLAKIDKLIERIEALRRVMFASHMEKTLLDNFFSSKVRTQGKNNDVLYCESFSVTPAFVHNFLRDASIINSLTELKFKKVILTNTFSTWERKLM